MSLVLSTLGQSALPAQNAYFSWNGLTALVTGVDVEAPTAEVVDMTPWDAPPGYLYLVPTGQYTGGVITVDCQHVAGAFSVWESGRIGQIGPLVFTVNGDDYYVARNCILLTVSDQIRVGDLVRVRMKFQVTDYQG